eukprot:UN05550
MLYFEVLVYITYICTNRYVLLCVYIYRYNLYVWMCLCICCV